jgi:hypothetical protein
VEVAAVLLLVLDDGHVGSATLEGIGSEFIVMETNCKIVLEIIRLTNNCDSTCNQKSYRTI